MGPFYFEEGMHHAVQMDDLDDEKIIHISREIGIF